MTRPQRRHQGTPTGRLLAWSVLGIAGVALGTAAVLYVAYRESAFRIEEVLASYDEATKYGALRIRYPFDGTLFPLEIVPPTFRWEDGREGADTWVITIRFQDGEAEMSFSCAGRQWTPPDAEWDVIKRRSLEKPAKVTILGVRRAAPKRILSAGTISITTSKDEVAAPIFYREVVLPFIEAVKDPAQIRWRFGTISSKSQPPVVLEKLPVCGNCHSFSADGTVLGMDVDYANDKGSYVIDRVAEEMVLEKPKIITWSDYKREDGELTFGLLSQVSPDGRYVVSTVKDRSIFVARDNLAYSQLFFPIKGILAVYDRQRKTFASLPGADDKRFVQSNPNWSPDGKYIVFARSEAHRLEKLEGKNKVLLSEEDCREFLQGGREFRFDLYRVPFNEGKGGKAEPLAGASHNGMSNYFPRYSPDGKWIVFCRAKSFMLLQPDSELYIIPASGGKARRLRCNTGQMNSWHSWSPNGRWLVFSSKANTVYTQLFLTHIDQRGYSSPPVVLSHFTEADRAANIPEFVNARPGTIKKIREQFIDEDSYLRTGYHFLGSKHYDGALESFRKALALNPNSAAAHDGCGMSLMELGKLDEAKTHFLRTIELDPDRESPHRNLGTILVRQGKLPEAIRAFREAVRLAPEFCWGHFHLGSVLSETGAAKEALAHLSEAARLNPNNPIIRFNLAIACRRDEKPELAVVHLNHAIEEKPDFVSALLELASIRATSRSDALRNGDEAVRLATKACELTGYEDPAALDVLGKACAEAGQFPDAIAAAERAVRILRVMGRNDLAELIQQRVARYRRRKPIRHADPP